jgi:serine/threonine-protein kinase
LPIAKQICEALEAAHERGIIHRDLKPANIKLTPDGMVKVLDFGLAKPNGGPANTTTSLSPTITSPAMTMAGVLLGSAAYMSPEQAKGREADKRSDVWGFACVLFEMLTGKRAFEGEDLTETIAAVVKSEPDWSALPQETPPTIRALLRRCFEKDRRRRVSDLSTALFAIEEQAIGQGGVVASSPRNQPLWRRALPLSAALLFVFAFAGAFAWYRSAAVVPLPVTRFSFPLGEGLRFTNPGRSVAAISPDGTKIVYAANAALYLRTLSDAKPTLIQGSQDQSGITSPAFSPDGESIVFFSTSDRQLKRISVNGGAPIPICTVDGGTYGVSWGPGGIVFGQGDNTDGTRINGILLASPDGGKPEILVRAAADERIYGPQILPGGSAILFTTMSSGPSDFSDDTVTWDKARVVIQSIGSKNRNTVIENASDARYMPTGHLVYAVGGILRAVAFDLKTRQTSGAPFPIVEGVRRGGSATGVAQFSVSDNGTLIYLPGPSSLRLRNVAFRDRHGRIEPLRIPAGSYEGVRVSRDGRWLAIGSDDGKAADISIYDLTGVASSLRRLTNGGRNRFPVWAPDSARIAFQSDRDGDPAIFVQHIDGSGVANRLTRPDRGVIHIPWSWSADGSILLFSARDGENTSLWTLSVRDGTATRFGGQQLTDGFSAEFSPDASLVAFTTVNRRVFSRLFLTRFPAVTIGAPPVTNGHIPTWSPDGKELFFGSRGAWFVANLVTHPALAIGEQTLLPITFIYNGPIGARSYDIMRDGKRFVGVVAPEDVVGPGNLEMQVVLNWFEELKQRVPVN